MIPHIILDSNKLDCTIHPALRFEPPFASWRWLACDNARTEFIKKANSIMMDPRQATDEKRRILIASLILEFIGKQKLDVPWPECKNCKQRYEDHARGKCLFGSTRYEPRPEMNVFGERINWVTYASPGVGIGNPHGIMSTKWSNETLAQDMAKISEEEDKRFLELIDECLKK